MGGRGGYSRIRVGGKLIYVKKSGAKPDIPDWHEAFDPGVDYEASGDVNHTTRRVSWHLQDRWDDFAHRDASSIDRFNLDKDWERVRGGGTTTYGYIRTFNSFKINEALYAPENAGKSDEEIFTRRDNAGRLRDLDTVRTLDRMIDTHRTSVKGTYSRYTSADAIMQTFGLSAEQLDTLSRAREMDDTHLRALSKAVRGSRGYSRAYTSTSANRSMNAFRGSNIWERRLYVPEGTKAYIPSHNAQESETIFGRHMNTRILGITVEDGKIVVHEAFDGYRKH